MRRRRPPYSRTRPRCAGTARPPRHAPPSPARASGTAPPVPPPAPAPALPSRPSASAAPIPGPWRRARGPPDEPRVEGEAVVAGAPPPAPPRGRPNPDCVRRPLARRRQHPNRRRSPRWPRPATPPPARPARRPPRSRTAAPPRSRPPTARVNACAVLTRTYTCQHKPVRHRPRESADPPRAPASPAVAHSSSRSEASISAPLQPSSPPALHPPALQPSRSPERAGLPSKRPGPGSEQPPLQWPGPPPGPGSPPQLIHQRRDVELGGALGDRQLRAISLFAFPAGDQLQHLQLALAEPPFRRCAGRWGC